MLSGEGTCKDIYSQEGHICVIHSNLVQNIGKLNLSIFLRLDDEDDIDIRDEDDEPSPDDDPNVTELPEKVGFVQCLLLQAAFRASNNFSFVERLVS